MKLKDIFIKHSLAKTDARIKAYPFDIPSIYRRHFTGSLENSLNHIISSQENYERFYHTQGIVATADNFSLVYLANEALLSTERSEFLFFENPEIVVAASYLHRKYSLDFSYPSKPKEFNHSHYDLHLETVEAIFKTLLKA